MKSGFGGLNLVADFRELVSLRFYTTLPCDIPDFGKFSSILQL
ncbi:hypothetical protein [Nostoc sp.]